ncbi:MAG TPA: flagellar assembly protein FliX [Stellaceae bacterium]|nr:flagellar assembly protein FliX [Stellaceae bacterium]
MRIEWTQPLRRATTRRDGKTDPASGEKFAAALSGEQAAAPPSAPPPLSPVELLLSVQEVPDALAGRRRAVQRGNSLLDRLEELRLGLLAGIIPRERLSELARLARTARETVDDPHLAALLDEIDLRVAVELAKLDIAV